MVKNKNREMATVHHFVVVVQNTRILYEDGVDHNKYSLSLLFLL